MAEVVILLVRYGLVVLFFPASAPDKILNFQGAVKQAKQVKQVKQVKQLFSSNAVAVTLILVLLIDLAWNSSRLEGNTYSLLDTKRLIELGEEAEGRAHLEAQMILNHKDAIEFLVSAADEIGFNRYTLLNLHALLANNLLADPTAAGRLRYIAVGIERSAFHPFEVPQLIEESFDQILATAAAINDPFEQAFFVMVQLPYLQPFDDVNKRVSRLAANIPFIKGNLSPLSFADVPRSIYTEAVLGVYELNKVDLLKDVFIWAYERSAARYAARPSITRRTRSVPASLSGANWGADRRAHPGSHWAQGRRGTNSRVVKEGNRPRRPCAFCRNRRSRAHESA